MTDQPTDKKKTTTVKPLGSPAHPSSKTTADDSSNSGKAKAKTHPSPTTGPAPAKPAGSSEKQKRSPISALALLIALGALGLAGYNYWQEQQHLKSSAQEAAESTTADQQLATSLSAASRQIQSLEDKIQRQQQVLAKQQREIVQYIDNQVEELSESFTQLENKAQQQLALADTAGPTQAINQALDFAYRKLNFERDVPATITLLESVINTYCLPPATAGLTPTCLGLEADRVSLKQVPLPNLNRILQELDGIQASLMAQRTAAFIAPAEQKTAEQPARSFSSLPNWRARLEYMLTSVSDFFKQHVVRIHKLDDIEPVRLTADQRSNLIQTIVLLIEQGKTASLRGDQLRYSAALTAAADALQTYLPNGEDSLNHERLLRTLSQITLKPELPRLTATYAALVSTAQAQEEAQKEAQQHAQQDADQAAEKADDAPDTKAEKRQAPTSSAETAPPEGM